MGFGKLLGWSQKGESKNSAGKTIELEKLV